MREAEGVSRLHNTNTDWPDSGYTRRIPFIPRAGRRGLFLFFHPCVSAFQYLSWPLRKNLFGFDAGGHSLYEWTS